MFGRVFGGKRRGMPGKLSQDAVSEKPGAQLFAVIVNCWIQTVMFPALNDSSQILFCGSAMAVRSAMAELFISGDSALLPEYPFISWPRPLLFVERLGWCLSKWNSIDPKVFDSEAIVREVLNIAWKLQQGAFSDELKTALTIGFLFLFEISDSPRFVNHFFVYILAPQISNEIFDVIRERYKQILVLD
jgi:hypothetical protein